MAEVAERIGASTSYVSSIERQVIFPSVPNLVLIVELFHCNLHELFFSDMLKGKVEEEASRYTPDFQIAKRLENMLSDLENKIRSECPDCAKKLNLT